MLLLPKNKKSLISFFNDDNKFNSYLLWPVLSRRFSLEIYDKSMNPDYIKFILNLYEQIKRTKHEVTNLNTFTHFLNKNLSYFENKGSKIDSDEDKLSSKDSDNSLTDLQRGDLSRSGRYSFTGGGKINIDFMKIRFLYFSKFL